MLSRKLQNALKVKDSMRIQGVSPSAYAYLAGQIQQKQDNVTVLIGRNYAEIESMASDLAFLMPDVAVHTFPAWDVQPYDRTGADSLIQAKRLKTLSSLKKGEKAVILTTVNALSIKVPCLEELPHSLKLSVNDTIDRDDVVNTLVHCGYLRVGTVMEAGEFSVRGSLIDIYSATDDAPIRIDLFDDEIESIKTFDPSSQRTEEDVSSITIRPANEIVLTEDAIKNFRKGYRENFPNGAEDAIYKDISAGRMHEMMDHYLPLFYKDALVPFTDILPQGTTILYAPIAQEAIKARIGEVNEAYDSRLNLLTSSAKGLDGETLEVYRPLKRETLYLLEADWKDALSAHQCITLEDFDDGSDDIIHQEIPSVLLADKNASTSADSVERTVNLIVQARKDKAKVLLSAFAPSSLAQLERTLADKGLTSTTPVDTYKKFIKAGAICTTVSSLGWGFYDKEANHLIITEQDIFGEKNNRPVKRRKQKSEEMMLHISAMEQGSLVVHEDHGIGMFNELTTLDAGGHTQDFVLLTYDGGDKLYVPVVSLDVLSKYGGDPESTKLDKLGGAAWQARKAKVKEDLLAMAGDLVKVAANRKVRQGHRYSQPDGLYDEFCAEFPYIPTAEQLKAVEDVEDDMFSDRAMDRLIVGDVGFGKTEVALRAAFVAAADGKQVALIVPTTLLARQHFENFQKRFAKFPFKVASLSRLNTTKQRNETLQGLADGQVDIVIGTHALLSDAVKFKDLGLMIVDEEQKFGVSHKEKLKKLKATVDVLTLTATPIPRTLQMSLSGLRTLSLITTPPVDRLAVRSYVMKFDRKVIREAILREIFRNGQVFVVTPRVSDVQRLTETIESLVPEAKVRFAHGQMAKDALDRTMTDFYEGKFNVLVATTIIESGIDVPKANTLIVHKADRFGLSQLYQIRGRVGRSKVRAYGYFLLPEGHMSEDAVKRLKILQRLDGIGAGFTLASYDMDIRGAGNILGKEQSGQVKEVGFELYNKMLSEAVAEIKAGASGEPAEAEAHYVPTLNLGLSFFIPENYVTDSNTRMSLYRRLSHLNDAESLDDFENELLDRFGKLPSEVKALLEVVAVKNTCRQLNVEKVDVGPKGIVLGFKENNFSKPAELMMHIQQNAPLWSIKPDQRIVINRPMGEGLKRLSTIAQVLDELHAL